MERKRKIKMNNIKQVVLIGAGLFVALNLHAAPLRSAVSTDLTAMMAMVSQTEPIPAEEVPPVGTFYSAQNPGSAPFPFNFQALPAWNLGNGMWLLDDLDADRVAQRSTMSRAMNMGVPMPGDGGGDSGGGDYTNNYVSYTWDTNQLWLEITNVSNGWSHLNLHNATNQVYAIWSTTNLLTPMAGWQVENELWPVGDQTNVLPFAVQNLDRQDLFLRAEDWTGVDSDGDGIPDWWIWKYFGDLSETATNLDSQGNTLLSDYQNTNDPNVISFTVRLGNQNFNSTLASGSYLVLGGVPSYEAVLVNDTNLNDAVWLPYDGNLTLNLGATDGVYQVTMGLKGRAADSQATWLGTKVTLTRTMPQITLTSPASGVVAQPYLQLQGYASLPLAKVTYDLNGQSNQLGSLIKSTLDTNTFSYTTDYFQCYDLLLNEGTNNLSLHATDPAGNVFTTNLAVILDYNTATNPVIQLTWPQNDMKLCGDNFTLRGWTEDAAAQVTVQINGTNSANGVVARNGKLWVENIPLNAGTNFVTLTVSNTAGFLSATNFMVVKSDMTLALTSIDGDLWLPTVNVNGVISDSTAPVWVNGIQGTNNGDGTWHADNVPVTEGGVASFDMSTLPPGAPDPATSTNIFKDDKLVMDSAIWQQKAYMVSGAVLAEGLRHEVTGSFIWGHGGSIHEVTESLDTNQAVVSTITTDSVLSSNGTSIISIHQTGSWGLDFTNTEVIPYLIAEEIGAMSYISPRQGWSKDSQVKMVFHTGGMGLPGSKVLVEATGSAGEEWPLATNVPLSEITADQVGQLDASGKAYGVFVEGTPVAVTSLTDRPLYTTEPGAGGYRLRINFNGADITDSNVTVIVGQKINPICGWLGGGGPVITNYSWSVPGITFSDYVATAESGKLYTDFPITNSGVNFYWVNGGSKQVSCIVQASGQTLSAQTTFDVLRPTAHIPTITGNVALDSDYDYFALHDGNPSTSPGITFYQTVNTPIGFSGETEWIQKITSTLRRRELVNTNTWYRLQASDVLDTCYPYPSYTNSTISADSPGQGVSSLWQAVSVSDNFERWLMFKPTGGQWVPLRKIGWQWSGIGNWDGTNWSLTNPSNPVGLDEDSTDHPQWSDNIVNHNFQQE